jgi:hypothetical protein
MKKPTGGWASLLIELLRGRWGAGRTLMMLEFAVFGAESKAGVNLRSYVGMTDNPKSVS